MAKYRKKPVVIEAIHTSRALYMAGRAWKELPPWLVAAYDRCEVLFVRDHVSITTLEGTMRAEPSDMIICGVKGEIYPCKPDVFAATYELVDDEPGPTADARKERGDGKA